MSTFIIPADGSSVDAGDFGKAADEALRRHREGLSEDQRRDAKLELEQLADAIDAAKQMVRSKAFGEHVYVVVSSSTNGNAWPPGSGNVVDIRVESRRAPERPQAEAPAGRRLTRAEQRQAARDAKAGRGNVSATQTPGVQQAPAPTPYMPGSRAEEIAAGRDPDGPVHTTVPPATGYGSAYMPGSRAEEIAAGRPLSSEQGPQVPSTQEEAQAAANRNAAQAEEQTRQAGRRAGRSATSNRARSGRGSARSSKAARRVNESGSGTGARAVGPAPAAGRSATGSATVTTNANRPARSSSSARRTSRTVKADPSLRQRGTSPKSNA